MSQITITLLFLLFAIVMFMWEKIPLGLTSMIVCVGLVVTGVLEWQTAFAGFIDSNVILFVAMFIVGGALFETGMANKIGGIVTHFAKTERQLIVAIMVIVGVMSGFLSNTGTAGNPDSGSYWNCSEVRVFPFQIVNAFGFCSSDGR